MDAKAGMDGDRSRGIRGACDEETHSVTIGGKYVG